MERGSENSAQRLLPLVYDELRRLATARMANEPSDHTLQPTALVHEAWLRLLGPNQSTWQNRAHFFGAAAEAMRRILIERARRKARLKRGAGLDRVNVDEIELAADSSNEDRLLLVNEALQKLESEDPQKARVVMLKFFGGLTNQEVAETLGVTERTVERQWAFSKAWLCREMRNRAG